MALTGTLIITKSSVASMTDLASAIASVKFVTTATSQDTRTITWTLGTDRLYSKNSDRVYSFIVRAKTAWVEARDYCKKPENDFYGRTGYLATVTSATENDFVSTTLGGRGWLGGADSRIEGDWRWVTGPESNKDSGNGQIFWSGKGLGAGGKSVDNAYTNWDRPSGDNPAGEPNSNGNEDFVFLAANGRWFDSEFADRVEGFICEWTGGSGVATKDGAAAIVFGSINVHPSGCIPKPGPTTCAGADKATCEANTECAFSGGSCAPGCAGSATGTSCGKNKNCRIDADSIPAICKPEPCAANTDATACAAAANCEMSNGTCTTITSGCGRYKTALECATDATCAMAATCTKATCASLYADNTVPSAPTCDAKCKERCKQDTSCTFQSASGTCADMKCQVSATECTKPKYQADCEVVTPKKVDKQNVAYDPTTGAVLLITLLPEPSTQALVKVFGATIYIMTGYTAGDVLTVRPPEGISATWKQDTGILVISGQGTGEDYIKTLQTVSYETTSILTHHRTVAWTLGTSSAAGSEGILFISQVPQAMLASEQRTAANVNKYVEYVFYEGISFKGALSGCTSRKFGLDKLAVAGELATIHSEIEQLAVTFSLGGPKAAWLGGMGTATKWKWVTGKVPAQFYVNGKSTIFSNWKVGEPSVSDGATSFLMIENTGDWRSKFEASPDASGYYCEFNIDAVPSAGDVVPAVWWSGTTQIRSSGCATKKCIWASEKQCKADPQCQFVGSKCTMSPCIGKLATCSESPECYYDPNGGDEGACLQFPPDVVQKCNAANKPTAGGGISTATCPVEDGCAVKGGKCVPGCDAKGAIGDDGAACMFDPTCAWDTETGCAPKLCGEGSEETCNVDPNCKFNWLTMTCDRQECAKIVDTTLCAANPACAWNGQAYPPCSKDLCPWGSAILCNADPKCQMNKVTMKCERNACPALSADKCTGDCTMGPNGVCDKAGCANVMTEAACLLASTDAMQCAWVEIVVLGDTPAAADTKKTVCQVKDMADLDLRGAPVSAAAAQSFAAQCAAQKPQPRSYVGLGVGMFILCATLLATFAWLWYRQKDQVSMLEQMKSGNDDVPEEEIQRPLISSYQQPPAPAQQSLASTQNQRPTQQLSPKSQTYSQPPQQAADDMMDEL